MTNLVCKVFFRTGILEPTRALPWNPMVFCSYVRVGLSYLPNFINSKICKIINCICTSANNVYYRLAKDILQIYKPTTLKIMTGLLAFLHCFYTGRNLIIMELDTTLNVSLCISSYHAFYMYGYKIQL